jgi:hypothetical protein
MKQLHQPRKRPQEAGASTIRAAKPLALRVQRFEAGAGVVTQAPPAGELAR